MPYIDVGLTWSNLGQQFGQQQLRSVCNLGNGIALVGTYPGGKILRSTDYGATWSDLGSPGSQSYIYSICHLGGGVVIASTGTNGRILRSTDYGASWSDLGQPFGYLTNIYSLCTLNSGIVLAGTSIGHIIRSTDYGLTWSDLGQKFSQANIYSVCDVGGGIALAGTHAGGYILRSTNYGLTWSNLGTPGTGVGAIYSLCNLGNGIVLAGGGYFTGKIFRSVDYGLSWSDLGQQASEANIHSLCYLGEEEEGVAIAGTAPNGRMLRSTDYGVTWINLGLSYTLNIIYSIDSFGEGTVIAGTGSSGSILRSTSTFVSSNTLPRRTLLTGTNYSLSPPDPTFNSTSIILPRRELNAGISYSLLVADFSADPTTTIATLPIQFTDESSDIADTYEWDFGDGSPVSTERNPVHIYEHVGFYTVTMTAILYGHVSVEIKPYYITIGMLAAFVGNPQLGNAPLTVGFVDQSIGEPTSWIWNFGDGSPNSTEQNPTHIYTDFGSYTVTLSVFNSTFSDIETKVRYINALVRIEPEIPLAADYGGGFTRLRGPSLIFD